MNNYGQVCFLQKGCRKQLFLVKATLSHSLHLSSAGLAPLCDLYFGGTATPLTTSHTWIPRSTCSPTNSTCTLCGLSWTNLYSEWMMGFSDFHLQSPLWVGHVLRSPYFCIRRPYHLAKRWHLDPLTLFMNCFFPSSGLTPKWIWEWAPCACGFPWEDWVHALPPPPPSSLQQGKRLITPAEEATLLQLTRVGSGGSP